MSWGLDLRLEAVVEREDRVRPRHGEDPPEAIGRLQEADREAAPRERLVGRDHRPQPARVDEAEPPQVEDHALGAGSGRAFHLELERLDAEQVEVPVHAEHDLSAEALGRCMKGGGADDDATLRAPGPDGNGKWSWRILATCPQRTSTSLAALSRRSRSGTWRRRSR